MASLKDTRIGVIGLGQMGCGMSVNLAKAGYKVTGFDPNPAPMNVLVQAGGTAAKNNEEIADNCEIIIIVLERNITLKVVENILLPRVRPGQIIIDSSTLPCADARKLGAEFTKKGCRYLDVPISGGVKKADAGTIRIFIGGDKTIADQCWPLFEAMGDKEKIVYCGELGLGQAAKAVQQLTDRYYLVACMEVMAFGLRAGLSMENLMRALDVAPGSASPYAKLHSAIQEDRIAKQNFIFAEWPYMLDEVRAKGFHLPMMEAMYAFCENAEKPHKDVVGRPMPSIWHELMRQR